MPTYQYACTACDERLEAVQSFADAPLTECPACAGALRKVFSAVGVVFKGSGFYKTDSRGSRAKGGDDAKVGAKAEGGSSESSSDGGSSTTPAAKTGSSDSGSSTGSTSSSSTTSTIPASKSA